MHCFFRKMGKATTNEVCLNDAFLDAVGTNTEKCWMASVLLENKTVSFKLNTGEQCQRRPSRCCQRHR